MTSTDGFVSYVSALASTCTDGELQQRLSLYQVFLRLYEHNRELLDEILGLENSGSKAARATSLPYVQGVISDQQIHLVTNLLQGRTQAILQPQVTWVIGRDSRRVTIPVPDKRLSRCHAAIRYVPDQGFQLIDLGSSNGSFINGELVRQSVLLKDGDRIRLGSLSFTFFVCHSVRVAEPLTPDVEAILNRATTPTSSLHSRHQSSDSAKQPPADGNPTALNLLDDTFVFMQELRNRRSLTKPQDN